MAKATGSVFNPAVAFVGQGGVVKGSVNGLDGCGVFCGGFLKLHGLSKATRTFRAMLDNDVA
ncbi:hypothetical protein FLX56_12160 [Synechococcus moorigangaii CMS01]|nr:hypothetical protein [Synechococcus moorigangaii CMS01]